MECKSRKSKGIWNSRQVWPWSTKWSRAKAKRVLPREHISHSKHLLPTTQEKTLYMDITRQSEIRSIISFAAKDGEALYSQQKPEHELTVAHIMNSLLQNSNLKRVGKTTVPFRHDLNQIPYDYTVIVRNRFKWLDLINRVAWWTMDGGSWRCTGNRDQDHPQEKEMQKSTMAVCGGLTNSCVKKRSKRKRRKGMI